MNAPLNPSTQQQLALAERIGEACARIAPTWPLDRFIAVNPYWGWVQQPVTSSAAELAALCGTPLTMPRAALREHWQAGRLRPEHLRRALQRCGSAMSLDALQAALESDAAPAQPPPLLAEHCGAAGDGTPMPWSDLLTHQISQHCAAHFDDGQAAWQLRAGDGLYASWRRQTAADRGLPWRQGRRWAAARLAALPAEPQALIAQALTALGIEEHSHTTYLSALLLSVNGWAAWCAYLRWQARLAGRDDAHLVELLAVRLAWEWLLLDDAKAGTIDPAWAVRWRADAWTRQVQTLARAQQADWLLQAAVEIAYQDTLLDGLAAASAPAATAAPPIAQAVFCIDVRSEVFRRALEAADPDVHTRGFAGFFGLPIAYSPLGSALQRPQLPGLLSPAASVSESAGSLALGQQLVRQRREALQWRRHWARLRGSAASAFSFVETCGLAYGAKLVADSLPRRDAPARWEDTGLPAARAAALRPRLAQTDADAAAAAPMAKGILAAMGLTQGFAPLVLLVGHGSQTANNPHAAGLDCGACGGQTGEVNARVLADLLNHPALRLALRPLGIEVPAGTHFVPALHNTTTDEVQLFDAEFVPPALRAELARLRQALASAGERARAERAPSLGLDVSALPAAALADALRERANHWAQVRPEWGLADNAAFIVAPRWRTQHMNLGGRSFLHDYDWRADAGLSVLELIMTAPMVVTNWINLQYHASTLDNPRYGSGNKLLHNVVGGHLGVFEGNGGDLRTGLPMQTLHDGRQWRHTPLRLSVFIEAPRAAIDTLIARHDVVRQLVDHEWLHLLRIDSDSGQVEVRRTGAWVDAAPARPA